VKNILVNIQARIQIGTSNGGKMDQNYFIVDTTINVCKINSGLAGNFHLKLMLEKLMKISNFTYECPFEKVFFFS
jgi:hypothetical protein